jgi:hypothetical protein
MIVRRRSPTRTYPTSNAYPVERTASTTDHFRLGLLPASEGNPDSSETSSSVPSKSATSATRPHSSSQRLTSLNTSTSTGTSDPSQPSSGSVSGSGSESASVPVLGRDRSFSHKWEVLAAPEGGATSTASAGTSPGGLSPHKWEVLVAPHTDASGSAASASQTSLDRPPLPRASSGQGLEDGDDHSGSRNVRIEVDAGRLDEGTEVLPPGYDPAWLAQRRRD